MALNLGRGPLGGFVVVNLLISIIALAIAGKVLDQGISGEDNGEGYISGFKGNGATPFFVGFSLICIGAAHASYISGLHHLRIWKSETAAAALALADVGMVLLFLIFSVAWKQIHVGGIHSSKLKALEAAVFLLTITHFIYSLLLRFGTTQYNDTPTKQYNNTPGPIYGNDVPMNQRTNGFQNSSPAV